MILWISQANHWIKLEFTAIYSFCYNFKEIIKENSKQIKIDKDFLFFPFLQIYFLDFTLIP